MKKQDAPSQQEIQDYLDALNRLVQSWSQNEQSEQIGRRAIDNYHAWFKSHRIAIYQDEKTTLWKLKPSKRNDESL